MPRVERMAEEAEAMEEVEERSHLKKRTDGGAAHGQFGRPVVERDA